MAYHNTAYWANADQDTVGAMGWLESAVAVRTDERGCPGQDLIKAPRSLTEDDSKPFSNVNLYRARRARGPGVVLKAFRSEAHQY